MLILGLILVAVAVAVVLSAVSGGSTDPVSFTVGFLDFDMSILAVFLLGAGGTGDTTTAASPSTGDTSTAGGTPPSGA